MSGALTGKLAVVTGVTSGIGEALTTALLARGARVAGVGRDPAKLAAAALRWGRAFLPVEADLSSSTARARCIEVVREEGGAVDLLVNNAAEVVYETPARLGAERWRRLIEVNLLAAIELVEGLVPAMRRGGHVVNVSSVTTRFLANAKFAPYALTKAALEQFTQGLRLELEPRGIKVSLVVPGLVDTPAYDKVQGVEGALAKVREQVPTWLSAQDVAEAIVWMLERPPPAVVTELVIMPSGQAR
ncbi:MAG: SDR family oxidoreductase [Myxococcaceae bacterium]